MCEFISSVLNVVIDAGLCCLTKYSLIMVLLFILINQYYNSQFFFVMA